MLNRKMIIQEIIQAGPMVTKEHRNLLNAPYTAHEVKNALFSILGSKAPKYD